MSKRKESDELRVIVLKKDPVIIKGLADLRFDIRRVSGDVADNLYAAYAYGASKKAIRFRSPTMRFDGILTDITITQKTVRGNAPRLSMRFMGKCVSDVYSGRRIVHRAPRMSFE